MRRWSIVMLSLLLCIGMMVPVAMASSATVTASFDDATRIATISGSLASAEGQIVTVQVRNALNQLDYLDQSTVGPGGYFQFSYKVSSTVVGTYKVKVGGQSADAVAATTFNVGSLAVALNTKLTPEQPDGQNGWYTHPVHVAIEAEHALPDGYSGEYRLNQGEWKAYSDAFMIDTDGITIVDYRIIDEDGAPGAMNSTTVKLDTKAPVTTATPSAIDGKDGWYLANPTITLSAADNLGEAQTQYRIDGAQWMTYTQPVTVSVYGIHNFEYMSIDPAGNAEEVKSVTLKIDKAPTIGIELDKTVLWPTNNKMVTVTANVYVVDHVSEIDSITLTSITTNESSYLDDIQDVQFGTNDTSFSLRATRNGKNSGRIYTITYTVTDVAGNKSTATATVEVPHDQSGKVKSLEESEAVSGAAGSDASTSGSAAPSGDANTSGSAAASSDANTSGSAPATSSDASTTGSAAASSGANTSGSASATSSDASTSSGATAGNSGNATAASSAATANGNSNGNGNNNGNNGNGNNKEKSK